MTFAIVNILVNFLDNFLFSERLGMVKVMQRESMESAGPNREIPF